MYDQELMLARKLAGHLCTTLHNDVSMQHNAGENAYQSQLWRGL